ncbi:MAG: DEAD/DEAH box helicase family protein [Deltaproteobacteria bacterium]|nr:DEAD/DEAH box helicase family protein [Deltaproteobacteria bacterium]
MKLCLIISLLSLASFSASSEKIELLDHQKKPIDYLLAHSEQKGLLVNHHMGTGKTYLAIGFAEHFPNTPIIVMAPRFIEGHWFEHMRRFGVKNQDRFEFISYQEAPQKLANRDLSNSIVILDEIHNLVQYLKSSNPEKNKQYVDLYLKIQKSKRVLGLTGTPIYSSEHDIGVLLNLVSGEELLPFNEEEFKVQFTEVVPWRSFWRGYFTESIIVRNATPMVYGAFAGSLFLSPFAMMGGMLVGIIGYPIVNALVPLEKYHLRRLDASKLSEMTQKYVSYYSLNEDKKEDYPKQKRHSVDVDYNPWQFEFFLKFAEFNLAEEELNLLLREEDSKVNREYIRINSTTLQKQLRGVPGAGRDIGNLGLQPSKFKQIIQKIGKQKTVVYSNYFENGIQLFAQYLDERDYAGKYGILLPWMKASEFSELVARYNSGELQILLLHPEVKEGISLKGTRQFHVMEPVLNATTLEQIIARAVRYRSHSDLPEKERKVDVYLWKSVLGGFNLKNFELRKQNWLKRYRELSDWSDFGRGIVQIDKNYDFKMYSPDEYASLKVNDLKENIEVFKEVLKESSVEIKSPKTKSLSKKEDELPYPTTDLKLAYYFNPQISWLGAHSMQELPRVESGLAYQLGFEAPLYQYLDAGAYVGFAGYRLKNAENKFYVLSTGLSMKVPYRIRWSQQMLSPYLSTSFGIVSVIDIASELGKYSQVREGDISTRSSELGFGAEGYVGTGIEYYPWPFVGVFIEGGWHALVAAHRVIKTTHTRQDFPNGGFSTSSHSEDTWSLNSYWMQNWQLQFGLKLGF